MICLPMSSVAKMFFLFLNEDVRVYDPQVSLLQGENSRGRDEKIVTSNSALAKLEKLCLAPSTS